MMTRLPFPPNRTSSIATPPTLRLLRICLFCILCFLSLPIPRPAFSDSPALSAASTSPTDAAETTGEDWPNPLILQRADPHVFRHTDGYYYFTATVPEYDRLELRRGRRLAELASAPARTVWTRPTEGPASGMIWAPEIHWIDGAWYLYFSAGLRQRPADMRLYVLRNTSANPLEGAWEGPIRIQTAWDTFTLDSTVFQHQGQLYLVWGQHEPGVPTNTNIYIARLADPTHLAGPPVRLSQPDLDWERQGILVNEGPAVLIRHGRIFITYSANPIDARYCMGLLSARQDADLLDPRSWEKSPQPVFQSNPARRIFGPGHNSFTTTADGRHDVLVYHARSYAQVRGDPLADPNRHTRAQIVRWNQPGMPDFGQPAAETSPAQRQSP